MDERTPATLTTREKVKRLAQVLGIGCCVLLTEYALGMWIATGMALAGGPEKTIWQVAPIFVFPATGILCAVGVGLIWKDSPWIPALAGAGLPSMVCVSSGQFGLLIFFLPMWAIWFCIAEATRRFKMWLSPAARAQRRRPAAREWLGLTR